MPDNSEAGEPSPSRTTSTHQHHYQSALPDAPPLQTEGLSDPSRHTPETWRNVPITGRDITNPRVGALPITRVRSLPARSSHQPQFISATETQRPRSVGAMIEFSHHFHQRGEPGGDDDPSSTQSLNVEHDAVVSNNLESSSTPSGVGTRLRYPTKPVHDLNLHSSGILTPLLAHSSPSQVDSQTSFGTIDHDDLPKYMSAFEYAIRPFMDERIHPESHLHLPSPTEASTMSEIVLSPAARPSETNESDTNGYDSDSDDPDHDHDKVPEDSVPLHVRRDNNFRTRIRLTHIRILLMRCQVLQDTVFLIQHKPWNTNLKHPPYWYYAKIRRMAYRARQLAAALQSDALLARCEYWAGRGCGGTRDYQLAVEHFSRAIKLDVENDEAKNGRLVLRGLRPDEKDDVDFLLQSVMTRWSTWQANCFRFQLLAENEAERTGHSIQACMEGIIPDVTSPVWMPDRDRIMAIAKREFGMRRRLGLRAAFLEKDDEEKIGREVEEQVSEEWEFECIGEREGCKRTLNEAEWWYIRHGDSMTRKEQIPEYDSEPWEAEERALSVESQSSFSSDLPSEPLYHGSSPPGFSPSTMSSTSESDHIEEQQPEENPLGRELRQAGWSSPSRRRSARRGSLSPPPPSRLGLRRHLIVPPIRTNF
ncbi:hypothetical protein P153DRAFT_385608 [Dothidotthia symphoricarpi CBS 119687]|uniref:Uncharacterized protein n=1 Tax=Dothidotthia symphoricarpi CBS 119687 TaxID=1392245 RepID=A0A6A6ACV3_9PLEO|nr:uncharacterized protein P153DRAFT_385608 [Dothidotthia symphoricarpi CBS 119687]KAF2129396.1 hypothetical protein P153DRAFT_385608 [Dothidotthia symphoricarpi CBS 119687]